jgi:phage-related minor tail protein
LSSERPVATSVLVAAGMALAGVAGAQPVASESSAPTIEFHLASESVGDALTAVGQQSGLSIAVASNLAKDLKSSAVNGRYTPMEALRRILTATGLRAEFLDRKTVVIVAAAEGVNSAVPRAAIDGKAPSETAAQANAPSGPRAPSPPCAASSERCPRE